MAENRIKEFSEKTKSFHKWAIIAGIVVIPGFWLISIIAAIFCWHCKHDCKESCPRLSFIKRKEKSCT